MGGQQAHFAGALFGRATATQARIEVAGDRSPRGKVRANPAFWGRRAHQDKGKPWIETSWDVGVPGEGPYAINSAIGRHRDDRDDQRYDRRLDDVLAKHCPTCRQTGMT